MSIHGNATHKEIIPGYFVSDNGEVISQARGKPRMLKPRPLPTGYLRVDCYGKTYYIHRLVATAFIGDIPPGYTVNHRDWDKSNNHVSNLEIISQADNNIHSMRILGNASKVRRSAVEAVKDGEYVVADSIVGLAKVLNIPRSSINNALLGHNTNNHPSGWVFSRI